MSTVDAFVRGDTASPARRRAWLGPVLAAGMLLLVGLVTLQPPATGVAFDPDSVGPTGLRGVVDVLRELDVDVELGDDLERAAAADTVLAPPLGWSDDELRGLAAGGVRVVAQLPPTPDATGVALGVGGIGLVDLEPSCQLLADVGALRTSVWTGYEAAPDTGSAERCIVRGDAAWLHRVDVGAGELVALGTMTPLTNARLVDSDAALAAVRLLAPTGRERVVVLTEPPGTPPPTLTDLIDRRWFDAAWLTLAVLLALALARGRRLGRPVDEQLPVRVPSGELARAIGDLRQRAGHDGRSAQELRTWTLTACRTRLGLPPSTPADEVLAALRSHGLAPSPGVEAALVGPLPRDGDGLVATARALAELRAGLTAGTTDRPSA